MKTQVLCSTIGSTKVRLACVFLCRATMSEALIPSGLLADEGQAEDNLIGGGGGGAILWQMEAIQS